jgi:hypothetical protein
VKIIRIKQKDLERLINEQIDPVTAVNIGKSLYDLTQKKEKSTKPQKDILPFTPQNLQSEIQKQGIVYPDVALAQATLESGHFSSPIFKENNNLFGMKLPQIRKTTAIGKNRGHAKYNNWQDSVMDYKLWQDSNGMSKLPKDRYIRKLSDIYCSPPDCVKGSYGKNILKMLQ